jgi:hypothetical protein
MKLRANNRVIDTSLLPPNDYTDPMHAPTITATHYHVGARSVVLLIAMKPA